MTQEQLEHAVMNKVTNGYMPVDFKNMILWATLTAIIISTSVVSYSIGYKTAITEKTSIQHQIYLNHQDYLKSLS